MAAEQLESVFTSHVVLRAASPTEDAVVVPSPALIQQLGGAANVSKLIAFLQQLMSDVDFFSATEEQIKQLLLKSSQDILSEAKAAAVSRLCLENLSEWRTNGLNSGDGLLEGVEWKLKLISCCSDALVRDPRIEFQLQTPETLLSLDADESGLRTLYKKLEEVQSKLDQLAKSSQKKA